MKVDRAMLEARMASTFPGLIGIEVELIEHGRSEMRLRIRPDHLAPNGYLHAGVVVGLADTGCGFGCMLSLPDGAVGFTTIELKTNFLATARDGKIRCTATLSHGGRTTQVWDAVVTNPSGKALAMFRCTQLLLYPPD
jgi:1,4-dihydroxy-2-naphthoyl-CoA hydrolase